jgi:hypothetical protein
MENNISTCVTRQEIINKTIWYGINIDGYIDKSLENRPAVYIFMKISYLGSKEAYYIGSTAQLVSLLINIGLVLTIKRWNHLYFIDLF